QAGVRGGGRSGVVAGGEDGAVGCPALASRHERERGEGGESAGDQWGKKGETAMHETSEGAAAGKNSDLLRLFRRAVRENVSRRNAKMFRDETAMRANVTLLAPPSRRFDCRPASVRLGHALELVA